MTLMTTRRSALAAAAVVGALVAGPSLASTANASQSAGTVTRIAGADRYEASANISKANYSPGVDVAYVTAGLLFTDALSGAPDAGLDSGPVLWTRPD